MRGLIKLDLVSMHYSLDLARCYNERLLLWSLARRILILHACKLSVRYVNERSAASGDFYHTDTEFSQWIYSCENSFREPEERNNVLTWGKNISSNQMILRASNLAL